MTLLMRHGEWEESKERERETEKGKGGETWRFHPTVKQISREVFKVAECESAGMKRIKRK